MFRTTRLLAVLFFATLMSLMVTTNHARASAEDTTESGVPPQQATAGQNRNHFLPLVTLSSSATPEMVAFGGQPAPNPIGNVPGSTVLWGAYVDRVPYDMSRLDNFERTVGQRAPIIHFGQPWQQNGQFLVFPTTHLNNISARGSIPMINWGSWNLGGGSEQPAFRLTEITSGRYDAYITSWARQAKAYGKPFFLKFNHEMDGNWQFAWSVQLNGNKPADYAPMWRHVHDIFAREGATNATWVWCPTTKNRNSVPFEQLYPGDAYVDWTCLHGYNFGGTDWRSFSEVFSGHEKNPFDSYGDMVQIAPSKPIMIGEWASAEAGDGGARKAAWIQDAFTQIPNRYPNIRAVVWFNWNAHSGRTWEVQSSPSSINAFAAAIASPVYASGSQVAAIANATDQAQTAAIASQQASTRTIFATP
jgi:hypothetical protein